MAQFCTQNAFHRLQFFELNYKFDGVVGAWRWDKNIYSTVVALIKNYFNLNSVENAEHEN